MTEREQSACFKKVVSSSPSKCEGSLEEVLPLGKVAMVQLQTASIKYHVCTGGTIRSSAETFRLLHSEFCLGKAVERHVGRTFDSQLLHRQIA